MQLLSQEYEMIKELLISAAVAHITVAVAVGVQRRKWRAKDAVVIRITPNNYALKISGLIAI